MTKTMTNDQLRKYWKHVCPKDRFIYEQVETRLSSDPDKDVTAWQVVDTKYGLCLMAGEGKYWQQVEMARFAKNYVRIHGDIDFRSFPYGIFDELHYDENTKPEEANNA